MSVNNLAEQLAWLLNTKPNIPPPTTTPTPTPTQETTTLTPVYASDNFSEQPVEQSTELHINEYPQSPQFRPEHTGGPQSPPSSLSDMVRLRNSPVPRARPEGPVARSLSNTVTSPKQLATDEANINTHSRTVVQTPQYTSRDLADVESLSTNQRARVDSKVDIHRGAPADQSAIVTLDLTDEPVRRTDGKGSKYETIIERVEEDASARTSRKRKSSEFEADNFDIIQNTPNPQKSPITSKFISIDDIPEYPPPPYSTTAPPSESRVNYAPAVPKRSLQEHEALAVQDGCKQDATLAPASIVQGISTLGTSSPHDAQAQPGHESYAAVADSEDEDEAMDIAEGRANVNGEQGAFPTPNDMAVDRRLPGIESGINKPYIDSHVLTDSKSAISVEGVQYSAPLCITPEYLKATEFNKSFGSNANSSQPLETKLSELDLRLIKLVLTWSDDKFQEHLETLTSRNKVTAAAIVEAWENGDDSDDLEDESQRIKKQIAATKELLDLCREQNHTLVKQKELRQKLIAMVEKDIDATTQKLEREASRTIAQTVRSNQPALIDLISKSGLDKILLQETPHQKSAQFPDIIIHSTQAPTSKSGPPILSYLCQEHTLSQSIQETPLRSTRPQNFPLKSETHMNNVRGTVQRENEKFDSEAKDWWFSPAKDQPDAVQSRKVPNLDLGGVPFEVNGKARSLNDFSDDEGSIFSNVMGSPPTNFHEDDEEFGYGDDCDDMLEAAESFEHNTEADPPLVSRRPVLGETSGNLVPSTPGRTFNAVKSTAEKRVKLSLSGKPAMIHPWTDDLAKALKNVFHLSGFRPNQLEAINATLSGKDVFVLMPTGGGKSLCYQLPAIINSGRHRGLTIVVSPLLSLMQDQVKHLQDLGIEADVINSEKSSSEKSVIMNMLRSPNADQSLKLLYVTPEMLSKNQTMRNALKTLHGNGLLARIVIDEAHCVSNWGHDFRPDYKLLGELREHLQVPMMALTATATENVKVDTMHNLGIEGCQVLTQSFNRPNLTYEVFPKGRNKDVMESMASIIQTKYMLQSGIIYCLSRNKCEEVAEVLQKEYSVKARHYHAQLDTRTKATVLQDWQSGKCQVVVATIAFGMGIDKPDVRFVIHHTLPKSLEGYYQETGRAGRDGKRSGCYLFYGYQDTSIIRRMIDGSDDSSWEQKQRQYQMLRNVVQYAENKSDCRRCQVLLYFGENFRKEDCLGCCDNCRSEDTFETKDFTDHAAKAVALVKTLEDSNLTLGQCVDMFRGIKIKKPFEGYDITELEEFGYGSTMDRNDIERLFYRLISEEALMEYQVVNRGKFATQYVRTGRKFGDFKRGKCAVNMQIRTSPNGKRQTSILTTKTKEKKSSKKDREITDERSEFGFSTNVSSPSRRIGKKASRAQRTGLVVSGKAAGTCTTKKRPAPTEAEPDEDDLDPAFEPVRIAGQVVKPRTPQFGEPITLDKRMEQLDSIHRLVLDDFMGHAKKECTDILINRKLREVPFTDTMLREMGIRFPKTLDDLCGIPGIDPDKVQIYGKKFLVLVAKAKSHYDSMKSADADKPYDPNHRTVVDLVSDDEDNNTSEYGDDDLGFEDDDFSFPDEQRSTYFVPEASNSKPDSGQIQRKAPGTSNKEQSKRSQWNNKSRNGSQGGVSVDRSKFSKRAGARKSSEGPGSRSGISKKRSMERKTGSARTNYASNDAGGRIRGSSAASSRAAIPTGFFNPGGIRAMPT